jgi:hypothetical protein
MIGRLWCDLRKQHIFGIQRRVGRESSVKTYACIDYEGRVGLRFEGKWEAEKLPALEFIVLTLSPASVATKTLDLVLSDEALLPLFHVLCDDLIVTASQKGSSLNTVVNRVEHWRTLLLDAKNEPLSGARLRGLVGELIVLERLSKTIGIEEAIAAWSGPLSTPQDFYTSLSSVEVKTLGPGARRVQVQSIEQLDPPHPGKLCLCIVVLRHAPEHASTPTSLRALLDRLVADLVDKPDAYAMLVGLLQVLGWRPISEANDVVFDLLSLRIFDVAGSFPRLRASNVLPGVSFICYEVELGAIGSFEVSAFPGEAH